jgi:hypothetical protein
VLSEFLDPGVDILLFGKTREVDVVKEWVRNLGSDVPAQVGIIVVQLGAWKALEVLEAGVDVDMVGTSGSPAARLSSVEIRDLKKRISEVVDAVLEGSQDRGRAAVAIQGFNALKSVLELKRKVKEQEEILERIEALEQSAETAKGGSRWGV